MTCGFFITGAAMTDEVLVLNHNYQPLNVTSKRRAVTLVYLGKAHPVDDGSSTRSSVVRLNHFIKRPIQIIRPTRKGIFTRDGYKCAYCGTAHLPLTIDHITPRAKGGENDWENLVCCCTKCNNLKGDRTPEEVGLSLKVKPRRPKCLPYISYHKFVNALNNPDWNDFLAPYAPAESIA